MSAFVHYVFSIENITLMDILVLIIAFGLAIYLLISLKDFLKNSYDLSQNELFEFKAKQPQNPTSRKNKSWFKVLVKKKVTINEGQNRIYIIM